MVYSRPQAYPLACKWFSLIILGNSFSGVWSRYIHLLIGVDTCTPPVSNCIRWTLIEFFLQIDGTVTFHIDLADIKRSQPYLNYRKLIVSADVTETLTGISLGGSSSVQFFDNPAKIEFLDTNSESFKPGLEYVAYVSCSMKTEYIMETEYI